MSWPSVLPYAYLLDDRGRAYLTQSGEAVQPRFRRSEMLTGKRMHLPHTLAVNDVLIALDLVARDRGTSLRIREELHEQALKRTPDRVELSDHTITSVIPDAICRLVFGMSFVWVAFEIDRSTAGQKSWRSKVEALIAWTEGPFQQRYEANELTFAIVATEGERRAAELLRWTQAELERLGRRALAPFFLITGASPVIMPPVVFVCGAHWCSPFSEQAQPLLERGEIGL